MGLNEEVQKHVKVTYLDPAKQRGESTIRIKAGDVHRDLHWSNRVPSVCTTLSSQKFQRETGLELVSKDGPPSGYSTTVVFTYNLATRNAAVQQERKKSRLEALYGTLSDVFRELGGGENFLRDEREKLHFRKEDDPAENDKGKQ
jgi:5-methylcytosine-specific restriction protein B